MAKQNAKPDPSTPEKQTRPAEADEQRDGEQRDASDQIKAQEERLNDLTRQIQEAEGRLAGANRSAREQLSQRAGESPAVQREHKEPYTTLRPINEAGAYFPRGARIWLTRRRAAQIGSRHVRPGHGADAA